MLKDLKPVRMTVRTIMRGVMSKCKNPYAMFNYAHAGKLAKRYSDEIIKVSMDKFPKEYKDLYPVKYLEGMIKKAIIEHPEINPVAEGNKEKAKDIQSMIQDLFRNEDNGQ